MGMNGIVFRGTSCESSLFVRLRRWGFIKRVLVVSVSNSGLRGNQKAGQELKWFNSRQFARLVEVEEEVEEKRHEVKLSDHAEEIMDQAKDQIHAEDSSEDGGQHGPVPLVRNGHAPLGTRNST